MIAHSEDLGLRAAHGTGSQVSFERGSPTGINMDRVASAILLPHPKRDFEIKLHNLTSKAI